MQPSLGPMPPPDGRPAWPGAQNGTVLPATLVGSLSSFYVQPAITGWQNQLREAVFGGNAPASLSHLYLFATLPPPREPRLSADQLTYRSRSYPARVSCQGQLARFLCLAVVSLPASVSPGRFSWTAEHVHGGRADGKGLQTVLVYPPTGDRQTTESTDLHILRTSAAGDLLSIQETREEAVRPVSPVVPAGRSRTLPLIGFAVPGAHQTEDTVYPADLLEAYAEGMANELADPVPGTVAYAGLAIGTSSARADLPGPAIVSEVVTGSPADDAGFQVGDQIIDFAGIRPTTPEGVRAIIARHRPGQIVKVAIRRAGARLTLTITLGYTPIS